MSSKKPAVTRRAFVTGGTTAMIQEILRPQMVATTRATRRRPMTATIPGTLAAPAKRSWSCCARICASTVRI